ncbi:TfoX/Sxy family protein [uncultured Nitratireductor sp.]|uniref:TfoX/Sxy family protein n=1 Tax=uncultured Nitratireductor sp. TaxID=520953 RepID=UPI0025DBA153|nr:TfoX/Sxy family protein [uncultured Nitratireductor sp.]
MDNDAIHDLFAGLGPVAIRRMFGGRGIYHQGVIFALEIGGEIVLKADQKTVTEFEKAGSRQWIYEGHKGRGPVAMPYWSIPDIAVDDPDEMARWAHRAFEAGLRSKKL